MSRPPIKRGYLTLCRSGTDSPNAGKRMLSLVRRLSDQSKWYVLRYSAIGTDANLDYFRDEKSAMHEDKLVGFHPLSSMSDVYQDRRDAKKFTIVTDAEVLVFKCLSMADAEDWVDALRPFVSPVGGKSNRFSTVETLSGKFVVSMLPSAASRRIGFEGRCTLEVTPSDIIVRDMNARRIERWPLHLIRKYGNSSDRFSFEAGSRCHSGEGVFTFSTFMESDAEKIHDTVHINSEVLANRGTDSNRYDSTKSLPRPPLPSTPGTPPAAAPTYEPLRLSKSNSNATSQYQSLGQPKPPQAPLYQPLKPQSPSAARPSEYQELKKP